MAVTTTRSAAALAATTPPAVTATSASGAKVGTSGLTAFTWSQRRVTAADLPHSWRRGCPVAPSALRALTLRFYGFDGHSHLGVLVVAASSVTNVVAVFRQLYAQRFPVRRMIPVDAYGGSDDRSVAADNTAGFNCRKAVTTGPASWSMHAYGLAIDIDPVENPYIEGGRVIPPAGSAFVNRSRVRPGMARPGSTVVSAFARRGWKWGGTWSDPDYQHFSTNGR
ncbi:MAG: hypothetical protein QOG52_1350 [Frankiaceae bacterium]|nr:hypothetical protein [Frankiaceae bacterium]